MKRIIVNTVSWGVLLGVAFWFAGWITINYGADILKLLGGG